MKRFPRLVIVLIILLVVPLSIIKAQDKKIDFTVSWKKDEAKSIIVVSVENGTPPFQCFVYDGSPFKGAKILAKVENVSDSKIEITVEAKQRVYVCVYKDDANIKGKWLEISE